MRELVETFVIWLVILAVPIGVTLAYHIVIVGIIVDIPLVLFLVFAIAVDFVSNRKMRTRIFTERPLRLRDLEGELPSGTGALIIDGRNFDTVWWSRQSFDEDEYLEHVPNSATRVRLPRRLAFALNLHVELANRYPRCSILCISVPL